MFVRGFCIRRANKGGTAGRRPVLYRKGQAFFCLPALRGRQTSRVSRSVEQPARRRCGFPWHPISRRCRRLAHRSARRLRHRRAVGAKEAPPALLDPRISDPHPEFVPAERESPGTDDDRWGTRQERNEDHGREDRGQGCDGSGECSGRFVYGKRGGRDEHGGRAPCGRCLSCDGRASHGWRPASDGSPHGGRLRAARGAFHPRHHPRGRSAGGRRGAEAHCGVAPVVDGHEA